MAKRVFTPEFKREAVRLASKPGISKSKAARELDIHPNVLNAWMVKFKSGKWEETAGADLKSAQAKEFERMKRELDKVTMERDIKGTLAFDRITEDCLFRKSDTPRKILEKQALDSGDRVQIQRFFS